MYIIYTAKDGAHNYQLGEITILPGGLPSIKVTEYFNPVGDNPAMPPMVRLMYPPADIASGDWNIYESVANWLVSETGPFPGGTLVTEAEYPLASARARVSAEVKIKRNLMEVTPLMTPKGPIDTDEDSQRKIVGACTMAHISLTLPDMPVFNVKWRMADNTLATLNAIDMITIGMMVGQHVAQMQMVKNYFDDLITAAETIEELEAINVDVDWSQITFDEE